MKLSAILPYSISGRAIGAAPGIRNHTFWKRLEFVVPTAAERDAPVVMYWNAAFDDLHDRYVSRDDWGPYPADGYQVVRYHGGEYWRQCMSFDVIGGELRSNVVDTSTLEELFTYPSRNDLVAKEGLPAVSRKKRLVADERELLNIVKPDILLSRAKQIESNLENVGNKLLIVGDTVFIRCGEPKVILTDCVRLDRRGVTSVRLLRIDTDSEFNARLEEARPNLVFPVCEFELAVEEAVHDFDMELARSFNEVRKPTILRPDLLPDIDIQTYRAVGALRRFYEICHTMEITVFQNPCGTAYRRLGEALRDYDSTPLNADVARLEDCLEECEKAFQREYYGILLVEARDNFDSRQISLEGSLRGATP